MKKIIACVVLCFMIAIIPLTLVGCKTKIEGTWVFADLKIEYAAGNEKATKEQIDATKKAYKDLKLYFYNNGKGKLTLETFEEEFSWKQIGNKIVTSDEDSEDEETIDYYLKNGKLYNENKLGNGNKFTIILKKK